MTELEKKAEEYQTGRKDLNYFSEPYKDKIRKAYIAGAKEIQEEMLKEIIEIEKVSDARWEENEQLKQENEQLQKHNKYVLDLIEAERRRQEECDDVHLRNIATLEKENVQLKQQIKKMKCCENCKYHSFWGDELKCNYGIKEALQEDKLVECEDMNKWELAE